MSYVSESSFSRGHTSETFSETVMTKTDDNFENLDDFEIISNEEMAQVSNQ